jgi:hypothetical protein
MFRYFAKVFIFVDKKKGNEYFTKFGKKMNSFAELLKRRKAFKTKESKSVVLTKGFNVKFCSLF